jgi:hypothetical protein
MTKSVRQGNSKQISPLSTKCARHYWAEPQIILDKRGGWWHNADLFSEFFTIGLLGEFAQRVAGCSTLRGGKMGRILGVVWLGAAAIVSAGCVADPLVDAAAFNRPELCVPVENPLYLPLGPNSYGMVFERVLSVIGDYAEIRYSNRYDGQVMTFGKVSPGLEQFWKPGSPDFYQRIEATFQTIRHRGEVLIQAAEDGGYFVHVTVYKDLEDIPRPLRSTAGAASFRSDNTVERQYEVIDASVLDSNWIPLGRDVPMEQAILHKIKKCL